MYMAFFSQSKVTGQIPVMRLIEQRRLTLNSRLHHLLVFSCAVVVKSLI